MSFKTVYSNQKQRGSHEQNIVKPNSIILFLFYLYVGPM